MGGVQPFASLRAEPVQPYMPSSGDCMFDKDMQWEVREGPPSLCPKILKLICIDNVLLCVASNKQSINFGQAAYEINPWTQTHKTAAYIDINRGPFLRERQQGDKNGQDLRKGTCHMDGCHALCCCRQAAESCLTILFHVKNRQQKYGSHCHLGGSLQQGPLSFWRKQTTATVVAQRIPIQLTLLPATCKVGRMQMRCCNWLNNDHASHHATPKQLFHILPHEIVAYPW